MFDPFLDVFRDDESSSADKANCIVEGGAREDVADTDQIKNFDVFESRKILAADVELFKERNCLDFD